MSIYTTNELLSPKILQRPIKWGLARSRRKSAATLMNYMRSQKTEIMPLTLQPLRPTRLQAILDNITAG